MLNQTQLSQYAIRAPWLLKREPGIKFQAAPSDVLAQCPKCKTVETLQFVGESLVPSRKFTQREGHVYHDCGSEHPCRLHRQSAGPRPGLPGLKW